MADLWLHDYKLAILQHHNLVTQLALHQIHVRRRRRRRRRPHVPRAIWVRPWISRRRQFGMYDQLLVESAKRTRWPSRTSSECPQRCTISWYSELVPDHQTKKLVQGAPGSWSEDCHHSAPHSLRDQVRGHEVWLEGTPQHPVTGRERSQPSHH